MQRYFDDIVKDIRKMVAFDSSFAPQEEGAPFGKETKACLTAFLDTAKNMGFETENYDSYVGEVRFGEGKDFALLAHLDVVPAGTGWKYPPFGGVIEDGKLYGRGTMDDKGPAVILLYCLKALKDEGILPKRRFKLIVGCNEETGWKCMEHYKKVATMPEEGFTPDADFPVIYAEKGILHLELSFPLENAPFVRLWGGTASNMVCARVDAVLKDGVTLPPAIENVETTGETVTAYGVSAHASTPHEGVNALEKMLYVLRHFDKGLDKAYSVLFDDTLRLKELSDVTGHLTMSPDVVRYENGTMYVVVDFRYPSTHEASEIFSALDKVGVKYTVKNHQLPLFNDPNGELITTLLSVYNDCTGRNARPIAIGGGTYARVLKNGCGFGPEDVGDKATIHQANEYITLEQIKKLSNIYYEALKRLSK